jgi:hypothetical protein
MVWKGGGQDGRVVVDKTQGCEFYSNTSQLLVALFKFIFFL